MLSKTCETFSERSKHKVSPWSLRPMKAPPAAIVALAALIIVGYVTSRVIDNTCSQAITNYGE